MEGRLRILLLSGALCATSLSAGAQEAASTPSDEPVFEPQVERREILMPEIDAEDIEVGPFVGLMSIEDFGVNTVYGVRIGYLITEDFFAEFALGRTEAEETSFERLSGDVQILPEDDRDLTYYSLSMGYNVLPGETFVGSRFAFNSGLYLIAGIGSTDFGGDDHFTVNAGFGYRLLLRDWLALHLTFRDHMFDHDLLGETKDVHNFELTTAVTLFF